MLKFNRGVLTASMIASLAATPFPAAHAVSDEVAVQLLERLGELELELSNLRGENEMLRKELLDVQASQREGFLEVDERVSGLEEKRLPGTTTTEQNTATPNDTDPLAATDTQALTSSGTEIPSLEETNNTDPLSTPSTVVATPSATITMTPGVPEVELNQEDNNPDQNTPQLASEDVAAQRVAVAPVTAVASDQLAVATDAAKVDPNSPDSYYFYGTQDKNNPTDADASKASLIAEKPVPAATTASTAPSASVQKTIPDAHKAKAAYNQAYKLLVNDPKSAVPAFRAFMKDYPDHELVANAQYWLGEALYAQKDFSGATQEFMQVLKKHKGSPKAPGAALKLGYSFYELRQWDFARRTLEDTVQFFPGTNAATLATNRLERMKAEGR